MTKVLIIGGGELGQALAHLASGRSEVLIFDQDKTKSNTDLSLEKLASQSEIIFLAVPAMSLGSVCFSLKKFITPTTLVVSLAKGMSGNKQFSSEVLLEHLPLEQVALLNGPMLAEEILQEKNAFASVTGHEKVLPKLQLVLDKDYLALKFSTDLLGASILGVAKNIYTVGLSVSLALDLGQNTFGALVMQSVLEMTKIKSFLGGQAETVLSLAGLADLVATSTSLHSRNRQVGSDLVTKGECCLASEGTLALPLFLDRVTEILPELPFLQAIERVVINKENPEYVFTNLVQKI